MSKSRDFLREAKLELDRRDVGMMNENMTFSEKIAKLSFVAALAHALILVAAHPGAADVKSPAKKTEYGYIYFPGTPFEDDEIFHQTFHIEALSHDVEVVADSESPVGIERAIVFTPLELWIERHREVSSITYFKDLDVDVSEVKRMFSQCAWKIGGSLAASDGPLPIISIVPAIKDKPFDVVKYNVMYSDDFGEMSFVGTQASFSSEASPHVFNMVTAYPSSYKTRGKFYIFVGQVLFSDGSTWEANYKKILGEFEFPVRSETPIESMVKNIVPEEKREVVSNGDRPIVDFNGVQIKINEGCDPWFRRNKTD